MEKGFIFNLSKEIDYTKDGDFAKTASIEFGAPCMDCFQEASDLQQLVARAFMSAAKSSPGQDACQNAESVTPSAKEIRIILNASSDVKFSDIAASFKKLAEHVATFDGVTKLKDDHFKKFEIEDFTGMICEYTANFTFPSLFAEL